MATTLRDFISQREAEIRDLQKALKAEMKDLQIARAALEGQPVATDRGQSSGFAGFTVQPTIKTLATMVLAEAPTGLTSAEILAAISTNYNRDLDRTSLSPQLSRLKDAGELVLEGEKWFTKEHHEKWLADELLGTGAAATVPDLNEIARPASSPKKVFGGGAFDDDLDDDVPF